MRRSQDMAFHELTTKAVKYRALSNGSGRVHLSWTVESGRLWLIWRESGGPPVALPQSKGFGSRLIERGLAGQLDGTVALGFPAEGVVCCIEMPVAGAGA